MAGMDPATLRRVIFSSSVGSLPSGFSRETFSISSWSVSKATPSSSLSIGAAPERISAVPRSCVGPSATWSASVFRSSGERCLYCDSCLESNTYSSRIDYPNNSWRVTWFSAGAGYVEGVFLLATLQPESNKHGSPTILIYLRAYGIDMLHNHHNRQTHARFAPQPRPQ